MAHGQPEPDRMPAIRDQSVSLVRSVQRAMAILNCFEGRGLQTLAEITKATGLDKGTTRRLLITLMTSSFIVQDPSTQRYGLGRAIRALAAGVVVEFDLRSIAVPILSELATRLQSTAFLSVYRDQQAVCIERVHDMNGMEVRWWSVGGVLPLNCGGAPKVLLAWQSDDEIDLALSQQTLVAMTPKSRTDKNDLKRHLKLIYKRGWELAVDDVALGLTALAMPVFEQSGKLLCVISIAGLSPQMIRQGRPVNLDDVTAAVKKIEAKLGRHR